MRSAQERWLRSLLSAIALVAAGVWVAAPPIEQPALAAPPGGRTSAACQTFVGVTVVVDYDSLGGIEIACAPHDVSTGLEALEVAGFSWAGTAQFFDFVCRINGLPTPDDDQCVRTPPADAYWSYWTAPRGGTWAFRSQGAGTVDPAPGTVEGWAFGAGDPPGTAPPDPPEPPTQPPPDPPPSSPSGPDPTPSDPGPDDETAATSPPTTTPTSTSAVTTASTTMESTATGRPGSGRKPPTPDPAAGSVASDSGGSPLGTIIGLVAAAAVAGAGAVIVLRRRQ